MRLLPFLAAVGLQASQYLSIPLQRDEDTLDSLRAATHHASAKYSQFLGLPPPKATNMTTFLANSGRWFYYGNIWLGSPGNAYICLFDTGSSDTWVFSKSNCEDNMFCTETSSRRKFNSSLSTSFTPIGTAFEASYGSGDIRGYWSRDRFWSGALRLPRQDFAEIQWASEAIARSPISSLVGLGWPDLSLHSKEHPTFLESIWAQYPDIPRLFSFWTREVAWPSTGQIYFGDWDPAAITAPVRWVDLVATNFWMVTMGWMSLWERNFDCFDFPVIVDSGTTFIVMPHEEWRRIVKYWGIQGPDYLVPCERMQHYPDLTLRLGAGQEPFVISPSQYMLPLGDKCTIGIRGWDDPGSSLWILGQTFFRAFFVAHDMDNRRIGFAPNSP